MQPEKKVFSETRLYPVFFMIAVAILFGTILAIFYHNTSDLIEAHRVLRLKGAILSLFDLPTVDIEASYEEYITEERENDMLYYVARDDTLTLGYCFAIEGSGLWGTITALLAVNPAFDRIIAFHILEQNETPGLGGRITEEDFLEQFSGKDFLSDDVIMQFSLVPEDEPTGRYEVNQITGATSSSRAVVNIIYQNLLEKRDIVEVQ